MRLRRIVKAAAVALSTAGVITFAGVQLVSPRAHAQDNAMSEQSQIIIGLRIAPSFINANGKNPALVGLGSFIVNGQSDCNGCHGSDPANEYLPTNNPYFLSPPSSSPREYNQATYLNGGQNFGPVGPGIVTDTNSHAICRPGAWPEHHQPQSHTGLHA
jgi:hypothetical protein